MAVLGLLSLILLSDRLTFFRATQEKPLLKNEKKLLLLCSINYTGLSAGKKAEDKEQGRKKILNFQKVKFIYKSN